MSEYSNLEQLRCSYFKRRMLSYYKTARTMWSTCSPALLHKHLTADLYLELQRKAFKLLYSQSYLSVCIARQLSHPPPHTF
jgi:hypothetical protein